MKILKSVTAENLTAWFIADKSDQTSRPIYMTLEEALQKEQVVVHETGNVNELLIDNRSDTDVLLLAGDIVRGGKQDRTMGVDFIVPKRSGDLPIPVFCVEQGRWNKRSREDNTKFSTSKYTSSSQLKKAIRKTKNQSCVWESVVQEQTVLSAACKTSTMDQASPTSLELTYESKVIAQNIEKIVSNLEQLPSDNARGVVWAMNGHITHADIFHDKALFGTVWKKLLHSAARESLTSDRKPQPEPAAEEVEKWLKSTRPRRSSQKTPLPPRTMETVYETDTYSRYETYDTEWKQEAIHEQIL